MADLLKTPLSDWHARHGGRSVDFGGWAMPVQYASIVAEHLAVRNGVGLFDVSHMGRLEFQGPDALDWLERATTNAVGRLAVGQVQYSLMANGGGGTIDDVLVYRAPMGHAMVCNASNRDSVVEALQGLVGERSASLEDRTLATAMVAVQGPKALELLGRLAGPEDRPQDLKYYHSTTATVAGRPAALSRTGYTGEDGFELIVAREDALALWEALLETGRDLGAIACGLGARDTLRLEAGMPLYGHELSPTIDAYSAGLGFAVKLDKGDFVGRDALVVKKAEAPTRRVGLELSEKRVARQGAAVLHEGQLVGEVTSGAPSPTLNKTIAMAYVPKGLATIGTQLTVDVRGRPDVARVVKLPFYRNA